MTIYTRHPNSAKPDKDQSTGCTITAVALLCVTVALPSGSAIGQSQIVPFHSGRAIGQSGVSQARLVGTWAYESVVVERTNGTRVAPLLLYPLMVDIPRNSSAPTYPKSPPRTG
jgi:hypothetical protein